jgi:hypothetical protein
MPALIPTDHVAEIVWLGVTANRAAQLQSTPREVLRLSFAGPEGEDHAGLTRPSDSRVLAQYPRDTEIRNVRQLSILSEEDIAAMAADMGLPGLAPTIFGATMVVRGIPDFTRIPPSSRLQDEASGTREPPDGLQDRYRDCPRGEETADPGDRRRWASRRSTCCPMAMTRPRSARISSTAWKDAPTAS